MTGRKASCSNDADICPVVVITFDPQHVNSYGKTALTFIIFFDCVVRWVGLMSFHFMNVVENSYPQSCFNRLDMSG